MNQIELTSSERRDGRLSPASRQRAVESLQADGIVVLVDVVDPSHVALLRDRMIADLNKILARTDAPFNFHAGNLQQQPPPFAPYLFRDVLANEFVIGVTHRVLGDGVSNAYYSGNTALPHSTSRQPVHPDNPPLWQGSERATPPFGFVVNVPLVDMTPENGSTEIWPGTHLDTSMNILNPDIKVPAELLEARRAARPPIQPCVRAGSAIIRDVRLWHAGMPNHTEQPRPMIAMIHRVAWWNADDPLELPADAEEIIAHPVLRTRARFVENVPNHLQHGSAFDFHS